MKNKKLFAILTLVCFLMTLMPVAAFAGVDVVAADRCVVELTGDDAVDVNANVELELVTMTNGDQTVTPEKGFVYVWAKEGDKVTSALNNTVNSVVKTPVAEAFKTPVTVSFARAGEYKLYAAYSTKDDAKIADLTAAQGSGEIVVTVAAEETNTDKYAVEVTEGSQVILANGLNNKLTLSFTDNGKALVKKAVAFKAPAGLTVTADAEKTSYTGAVDVKVAASRAGEYKVTATIDGKKLSFAVKAVGTAPVKIETVAQPEKLIALDNNFDAEDVAEFELRDIHNNVVSNVADEEFNYVNVVELEAPAKSTVKEENLSVNADGVLVSNKAFDKEGKYTVTVALANGSSAKASWEVKKVGDPVKLVIDAPATAQLEDDVTVEFKHVDANGLETAVPFSDVKFFVTGRAAAKVDRNVVTVAADEKYLGQEIVLNAIDKDNDLVATAKVKVVEDSRDIAFEDVTLETYKTNKVEWNIVDAEGNAIEMAPTAANVEYFILNKPADAEVSAPSQKYTATGFNGTKVFAGKGEMAISCDKPGNVTVQVVAEVKGQFYVGTKVFAVGGASVGDVVVMTIGTQTLVKNGEVTTMDATPIIKDNRTFVPFRALAEAFGANVDYNEADKTVTAELAGNTVVMTIGSNAYTVNGAEKTMDVAPYIDGERTMVPVRFVAEAFGIDVTAVPDVTDGTTASVIFNK